MTRKNCKTEHNSELLADYTKGYGRKYLAKKYMISQSRVRNLVAFFYLKDTHEQPRTESQT